MATPVPPMETQPPRKSRTGIVIAVVIVVVILVVVLLFVLRIGLLAPASRPQVTLAGFGIDPCSYGACLGTVSAASPEEPLGSYRVRVTSGSQIVIAAGTPANNVPLTNGSQAFVYNDTDLDGRVSAGDLFALSAPAGASYSVEFLWAADSAVVARFEFIMAEQKPIVALAQSFSGCTATSCSAQVVATTSSAEVSKFRVTVQNGTSVAIPLTTLSAGPISGGGLSLSYVDVGGEGRLNGGDVFTVTGTVPGGSYTINLFWAADGTSIASVTLYP